MQHDVMMRLRRLQFLAKRKVRTNFGGEYRSTFKGSGLSFEDVREYQPGDDIRLIDWNVTARMNNTFVKRYTEERELTIHLLVDLSAGMRFGSTATTKRQVAIELAAVLAFSAATHNDRVGLMTFTDKPEQIIRPGKGLGFILRLLRVLLQAKSEGVGSRVDVALRELNRRQRRRSVVFVLSDFQKPLPTQELRQLAMKHDVMFLRIADPLELAWPAIGLVRLEDPETGYKVLIDTDRADFRDAFRQRAEIQRKACTEQAKEAGIDVIDTLTDGKHYRELIRYFRTRRQQQTRSRG